MGASWFQRFWRWTVVLLFVCLVVDFWEFSSYLHMTPPAGTSQVMQVAYQAGAMAGQVWWAFVGHVLRLLFLVAAIMLVLVELVAWVNRVWRGRVLRRDRRARRRDDEVFIRDDL